MFKTIFYESIKDKVFFRYSKTSLNKLTVNQKENGVVTYGKMGVGYCVIFSIELYPVSKPSVSGQIPCLISLGMIFDFTRIPHFFPNFSTFQKTNDDISYRLLQSNGVEVQRPPLVRDVSVTTVDRLVNLADRAVLKVIHRQTDMSVLQLGQTHQPSRQSSTQGST